MATRRHRGGRRNLSRRKQRGVFETAYSPVHVGVNTSRKVLSTVSRSVNRLLGNANNAVGTVFKGANSAIRSVVSRKNRKSRKNSRRHRRNSRR